MKGYYFTEEGHEVNLTPIELTGELESSMTKLDSKLPDAIRLTESTFWALYALNMRVVSDKGKARKISGRILISK